MSKRSQRIACIPWHTCWKSMTGSKLKYEQLSYVRRRSIAITTEGACQRGRRETSWTKGLTIIAQCFCPKKKEKLQEARVSISQVNCSPNKDIIKDTTNNSSSGQDPTVKIEAKAKVRSRAKGKRDGAQVQHRPLLNLGNATLGHSIYPNPNLLLNVNPNISGKRDQQKPNHLLQITLPRTNELIAGL